MVLHHIYSATWDNLTVCAHILLECNQAKLMQPIKTSVFFLPCCKCKHSPSRLWCSMRRINISCLLLVRTEEIITYWQLARLLRCFFCLSYALRSSDGEDIHNGISVLIHSKTYLSWACSKTKKLKLKRVELLFLCYDKMKL